MITEQQIKDALVRDYGWNGNTLGVPLVGLTYSFSSNIAYWKSFDYRVHGVKENTFLSLLPEQESKQQAAFSQAVKFWSDIANIDLKQGTPHSFTTGSTTVQFGDIVVANGELEQSPKELTLATTIGSSSIRDAVNLAGDIVIDMVQAKSINLSLKLGQEGFSTLVHELGHALGLNHPKINGNENGGYNLTQKYTVMSYTEMNGKDGKDGTKGGVIKLEDGTQWYPSKPMLYDILAIQTLYGVNPNTGSGDTSYYFGKGADAVQAIWDAGGNDTIDASTQTKGVTIDLRPGHFSFVGSSEETSTSLIAIAFQPTGYEGNWIENAIGTDYKDKLTGNNANNSLTGGGGDDILEGGLGLDTLDGGIGSDIYIWHTDDGSDTLIDADGKGKILIDNGSSQELLAAGVFIETAVGSHIWKKTMGDGSVLTLTHNSPWRLITNDGSEIVLGNDWQDSHLGLHLQNALSLTLIIPTNEILGDANPNLLTDTLNGSLNNDHIMGKLASDTLDGKAGNDVIEGGDGRDNLIGEDGNDTLIGGDGADYFDGGLGDDVYQDVSSLDTVFDNTGNDVLLLQNASGLSTTQALTLAGATSLAVTLDTGNTLNLLDVFFGSHFTLQFSNGTAIDLEAFIANNFTTYLNLQMDDNGGRLYGGANQDTLYGGLGNDTILGYDGNDLLVGQGGNNVLDGGAGNDTYIVDQTSDIVIENLNQGTDIVYASVIYG